MTTGPEKFEINLDGITYKVTRSATDKNIYKLKSPQGSYLIARDFYGFWVELTRTSGSASVSLIQIGRLIEDYYNSVNSF
jgi:hypothetical protein